MSIDSDHARFMAKNARMMREWAPAHHEEKQERPKSEPKMALCEKCRKEKLCRPYHFKETKREQGVATYGTVVRLLCEDCRPGKNREENAPPMASHEVKNLLKSMKKGLR
jgi:hypothetical protein